MKKFLGILGTAAVGSLLLIWSSPVSAQQTTATATPSSVPAETGTVTLTISGTGFAGQQGVYISPCPGANGDADSITAANAAVLCPTIGMDVFNTNTGITLADDGTFTTEFEVTITQSDIDAGALVLAVGATLDLAGTYAARIILQIDSPAAPPPVEEPLATTGVGSTTVAIIAGSIVVAGLMLAAVSRRLKRI